MQKVAGANLFGQWLSDEPIINKFKNICTDNKPEFNLKYPELVSSNWSYNIFKVEKSYYVSGSWHGEEKKLTKVKLPEECGVFPDTDFTMVGNDYSLILINMKTHTTWIMSLESEDNVRKINFNIEVPITDLKENCPKKMKRDDSILKAVPTNTSCLYLTAHGVVYSGLLPSHLDTSHCEGNICDIKCGYEHFMLLTDVGKIYTWGNGRRLQLGHGDLTNLESPTEVEALAGIKIIKIQAGGWHSLALSEYGDLYAWGWNDTGQLGIKSQPDNIREGVLNKEGLKSFPLPTLVDIFDENDEEVHLNVKSIASGTRHSAILLEDNTVWTTGFNKYGQLGFSEKEHPTVNYFKKSFTCENVFDLQCGPWSTVLVECNT